jgi:KipI family sensor histidine kinase inhibitor
MYEKAQYLICGDSALNIEFGNEISEEINKKIRVAAALIENREISGISEVVPTYRSLMIHYDPLIIEYEELISILKWIEENIKNVELYSPEIIEIPVLYGGQYGPDIENVAMHNKLTVEEVIKIHTSAEYLIYMLGFTPGFPYLGGMDKRIATPRLHSPRTKIPAGSVGIAGEQTGIYPVQSPGGWQLIGSTPIELFNPDIENPILLKSGNYIVFKSIDEEEYMKIKEEVKNNAHKCKLSRKGGLKWDK